MSENPTSETNEIDEKSEGRPGSLIAKVQGTLAYSETVEIPIEVQAKIAKIVEDLVSKEVERKMTELSGKIAVENSRGRYFVGFYMSAGLSAFAGVLGYAYFGGLLGLLLIAAAAGPFLMSLLGLYRSQER